jgi:hypothetical protein
LGDSLNLKTNRWSFRINYFSSWENNENWKHTQKNNFGAIPKKVNGPLFAKHLFQTTAQHHQPAAFLSTVLRTKGKCLKLQHQLNFKRERME